MILLIAGRVAVASKDYARAEQLLAHAIEKNPSLSAAYSMLGHIFMSQKRLDEARGQFKKSRGRRSARRPR